jgi:hypothetical protein
VVGFVTKQDTEKLVKAIEAFCKKRGIALSTFGRLSVNDGKFVARISKGGWIKPETSRRAFDFMNRAKEDGVFLRGRPRRKKQESNAYTMAELVNQETSIRTPDSFALHEQRHRFHLFAATTNEAWVQADIISEDILRLTPGSQGLRLFYAPMDNGVSLTRVLRAVHANYPNIPIQVVIKGWSLEDLRNTMGRMVDRLAEHPLTVLILTNLYTREAVQLKKTAAEGPQDLSWQDVGLNGDRSYDYQQQVADLFPKLANEWVMVQGEDDFPVYTKPSVVIIYRADHKAGLAHLIPEQGKAHLQFDYCFLSHPFLHSHTMRFRIEYILDPVIRHLAPGGRVKVVQSLGQDPAHEIVQRVWPDQSLKSVSRHDIISELRKYLRFDQKDLAFSGVTGARSLFRFDMHTLPIIKGDDSALLSLQGAWNNAIYFAQVKEELAQATMQESTRYLDITGDVLRENGGLWFINETFSISRKP